MFSQINSVQSEAVLLKCAKDTEVQGFKYHKGEKMNDFADSHKRKKMTCKSLKGRNSVHPDK